MSMRRPLDLRIRSTNFLHLGRRQHQVGQLVPSARAINFRRGSLIDTASKTRPTSSRGSCSECVILGEPGRALLDPGQLRRDLTDPRRRIPPTRRECERSRWVAAGQVL